jgi:hypothetical protein
LQLRLFQTMGEIATEQKLDHHPAHPDRPSQALP